MIAITPGKPTAATPVDRGPLLRLRLSDGYSWSHEFDAGSADALAAGCALAWARFVERIPQHQSHKRAAQKQRLLELHVRSPIGDWINANYGTDSASRIVILYGPVPNVEFIWLRCLRAWSAAHELAKFVSRFPKFLDDNGVGS